MTKQQLKIDLDSLRYCPHEAVTKTYTEANADHLLFDRPEFINERRIYLCSKASKKPIKHKITGIYRKQLPGGKEYCFFHEAMVTHDYFGNVVDHTRLCGRYEMPIIQKSYGIPQGRRLVSNTDITKAMEAEELEVYINDIQQVHEWEFEDIKPQLLLWREQNIIDENTKLYAWMGSTKFSVQKFEDFIGLPIDDLVLLNKAGKFAGLLKGQELTPEILNALREKLTAETIQEIKKVPNK